MTVHWRTEQPSRFKLMAFLDKHAHFVFMTPAILCLFVLTIFPILYTLWMSLHSWQVSTIHPPEFIGSANYARLLFGDARMREAIVRTVVFTVSAVTVELVGGVVLALLFNRQFWGRGFLRSLAMLPMVTTPVAIGLIFVLMMHPTLGVLNYLLSLVGLKSLWIYDAVSVIPALILVDAWQWTPLIMLMALAALATLPNEPYEAARIDGASAWQSFWLITLPLIRPALMVAVLFRGIDALKTFDVIFTMTGGGPANASETINMYLFATAFTYFDMGYASTIVVVFFTIILALAVLTIRFRRNDWQ
jgi:multiple sugar transport system permease protein